MIRHTRDLAGTFGNDCVLYLTQDRKASVRIGRPADRGFSPLVLHLGYRTSSVSGTSTDPMPYDQLKPM
jgi:hypothetical protein